MENLAFFDLDHTLLPLDSDYEWTRFMVQQGWVDQDPFMQRNEQFYADYQKGCLDIQAYLRHVLAPLAWHTRAQLVQWHEQFMHTVITPSIHPAALELVREHQAQGDLCCLITATNHFVIAPIAKALGFEADAVIASIPATVNDDPNAAYTGEVEGVPSYREGKITRAHTWLNARQKDWSHFKQTYFYSDSHNDMPLLEKVTHPIATNPDDILRAHAHMHGWRILDLFAST